MTCVIDARDVRKTYQGGGGDAVLACDGVNVQVAAKEVVAIVGPSGSGKSTLMHLLGTVDDIDEGSLTICGQEISPMKQPEKAAFRREHIGFVFQSFHLVPTLTAAENVGLSAIIGNRRRKEWDGRARELLARVGLEELAGRKPDEMSGGQQQRIAVARALFSQPHVLLADEPTGNLDQKAAGEVMRMLREAVDDGQAQCAVIVTHSERSSAAADRVLLFVDGRVRDEMTFDDGGWAPEKEVARIERLRHWMSSAGC
ncbi:ATP-binding cassette domain-containing protein [Dermatophilus congolensis]|uniref:ATP-binding cassette domain-containing protein n=1 Tax=Dermatophilus congolensis TaxID=1863 RepID=UPI001AAEEF51|nr:ABC transporter ATP-binding protein [Dermatophilus congolensis]MBO3151134.1 ABC transporter ATP-binding protein [Dermatophilus congolensis]MBO3161864.1 ABC transporter ATP-binding protein [Dermatophilus congolensis]MBO3162417.1 ABC transporter ATP-binding protein [Dermatophilus congolensis]MBO3175975.1 ABC transporter ATP-binding protein [Dermatophilus congolensis]